ncbi:hypothetical protein U1Q18_037720 [Sarracenia purpurea var. burkii]
MEARSNGERERNSYSDAKEGGSGGVEAEAGVVLVWRLRWWCCGGVGGFGDANDIVSGGVKGMHGVRWLTVMVLNES